MMPGLLRERSLDVKAHRHHRLPQRLTHAGVGNITRAEAALFAIMFGKNLAEPASPFEQNNDAAKRAAGGGSSSRSSRHNVSRDDGFAYLGRKCLWLGKDYAVSLPPPPPQDIV